ncbi:hypothetical protein [Clostridium sp.]|uniref:hypothetical protein n=1 Tax=Clostridium sp. TaxID=1506 RepID=UPI002FC76A7D
MEALDKMHLRLVMSLQPVLKSLNHDEYDKGGYEALHSYLIYYIYHETIMPLNRDTADKLVRIVAEKYMKMKQG